MYQTIIVPTYKYEELERKLSCQELAEGKNPKGTVIWQNKEYLIDAGYYRQGRYYKLQGNEVIDLDKYEGPLKPLSTTDHLAECKFGRRERGGAGELVKFGSRKLVTLERYDFTEEQIGTQIQIF